MMSDEDLKVRKLAAKRILEARRNAEPNKVRIFKVPKVNFNCAHYSKLISWKSVKVTSPPIFSQLSNEDIRNLALSSNSRLDNFPNHTQAVERDIKSKLVSEAYL